MMADGVARAGPDDRADVEVGRPRGLTALRSVVGSRGGDATVREELRGRHPTAVARKCNSTDTPASVRIIIPSHPVLQYSITNCNTGHKHIPPPGLEPGSLG